MNNITAVILAGGKSHRMGTPKPLLKLKNKTFLDLIREKITEAGIKNIYLVLGADAEYLRNNLNTENLNIIINKSWQNGQLSSLKAAIKRVKKETDGIIMFLIDHPSVKVSTIKKLLEAFREGSADIIVPEYEGRGGHPVIFSRNVFIALLQAPLNEGARAVVRNTKYITKRIRVNDRHIRQDIDTPEDFKKIGTG